MENIGAAEIIAILGLLGGFVTTVFVIVWRIAILSTKIERNECSAKLAHERIDKYSGKHETSIEEIRQQISSIVQTQVRIEEKIGFLLEARTKSH